VQLALSAVLVLGVVVWLLIRKGGLKPLNALAAVLLGFYLARSSLAPSIHGVLGDVTAMLAGIRL
jgi:hypothetical protein